MPLLDRAFAAIYDPMMAGAERAGLADLRAELLAPLTGHVLEIGAGTGANLEHYPPGVTRLTCCEPVPEMRRRLEDRVQAAPPTAVELDVRAAPAEQPPAGDASVDHVVSTLVLCTVTDLAAAVAEIRRVLRPGGTLVMVEHVVSPGPVARRVQHALTPAWKVVARGCHLDRDTVGALASAGFDLREVQPIRLPGVDRTGTVVAGSARAPG